MTNRKKALIVFNNDLRLHDNPGLSWCASVQNDIVGVFLIDEKKSVQRRNFLLACAQEIQRKFREAHLDFHIFNSDLSEMVFLLERNKIDFLVTQDPLNYQDQEAVDSLKKRGSEWEVVTFQNQTLIDLTRLPFKVANLPLVYTDFRKAVMDLPIPPPERAVDLNQFQSFELELPENLKYQEVPSKPLNFSIPFGLGAGESAGLHRISEYISDPEKIRNYKNTRNGLLHLDDSSKLSIYLSCGALSARQIHWELMKLEAQYSRNESTTWYFYELLWRDYFKILALKLGPSLFSRSGLKKQTSVEISDSESSEKVFQNWKEGRTGQSFIDANMRELNSTGWMSNRGRQNVASFLCKTLNLDWTWGANYFAETLIDYDIENNWGNWLYLSGVGTDPRNRKFNPELQAEIYDPLKNYQNKWLS